jgi:phosphatidylglycerophosphatase A
LKNKYLNAIIKAAASGLGTGYSPLASGTAASLFAAAVWWFTPDSNPLRIALVSAVLIISVPISTAAEILYQKKDDSRIVIDEVAGMWVSLLFLPHNLKIFTAAFILFRIFDVIKPFGIRRIQAWRGGWGIVADDFFAGILANVFIRLALYISNLI